MATKKVEAKKFTQDIVLIIAVIAGVVSFFYNPTGIDMTFLRTLIGGIVGYYLGMEEIPVMRAVAPKK